MLNLPVSRKNRRPDSEQPVSDSELESEDEEADETDDAVEFGVDVELFTGTLHWCAPSSAPLRMLGILIVAIAPPSSAEVRTGKVISFWAAEIQVH
eukprot:3087904-Pyramimonas_sp.AAC.2